jgi:beta-eliminating lyase
MRQPDPDRLIELRSDTFGMPTAEMRRAVAKVNLGNEGYGEAPTVKELEIYCAEPFGQEDACLFPSRTMASLAAMVALRRRAREPSSAAIPTSTVMRMAERRWPEIGRILGWDWEPVFVRFEEASHPFKLQSPFVLSDTRLREVLRMTEADPHEALAQTVRWLWDHGVERYDVDRRTPNALAWWTRTLSSWAHALLSYLARPNAELASQGACCESFALIA